MGDVVTFRPRDTAPLIPPAPSPAETRRVIEEAAQAALDTADNLLAILDRMDGDADTEDGGATEPALAATENHRKPVVWLRNNDSGAVAEAPKMGLPVLAVERSVIPFAPLPWGGSGNVVAAAGVVLFDMVAGR